MLGGVAAGIARYFSVDPTLVRLLIIVVGVFRVEVALLGYVALWIVMPRAGQAEDSAERGEPISGGAQPDGSLVLGALLVVLGVVLLAGELNLLAWLGFGLLRAAWPVLLIAAGIALIFGRHRGRAG